MFTPHTHCRACGYAKQTVPNGIKAEANNERLIDVFDLGIQPLANDFCTDGQERAGYAPLKVLYCPRCTLAQLSVVVKPEILYANYPYVTSKSTTMQNHFKALWEEIQKEVFPRQVVEIGSNDGDCLGYTKDRYALNVLGIDPAKNLVATAIQSGIPTICSQFNEESARRAKKRIASYPDVILARHVFAHIDDWQEFLRGIRALAGLETLTVIEIPYVLDVLNKCEFDTIYHEHLSYVSLRAIQHLLKDPGLHLHKIIRFPIHGGALALMIRRDQSEKQVDMSVAEYLDAENITLESWLEFRGRASTAQEDLRLFIRDQILHRKTVCGFGASAKSTVWINACGFTRKDIRFICDSTPAKQYKVSPGSDIPIVDEGALMRELPDVCINFAWNFRDAVMEKNRNYLAKGGVIVSPYLD